MALADTIEEIKTICWCGKKATMNARLIDGRITREGPQVLIGGNSTYIALCRKHWREGQPVPPGARPEVQDPAPQMYPGKEST
jgi:thymidine kinase